MPPPAAPFVDGLALDHQSTVAAILFMLALVKDPELLAELAEAVEQVRPRAKA